MNKALFLDRDGVINIDKHHLYQIEKFEFIPGIFNLCKHYQDLSYLIIVVTNQAGIAKGYYSEEKYLHLTNWMVEQFFIRGINISKVYHCPHHPDISGECQCRKPNPGMIFQAQHEFKIDLKMSILIGDKKSDILAAESAGIGEIHLLESPKELRNILSNYE